MSIQVKMNFKITVLLITVFLVSACSTQKKVLTYDDQLQQYRAKYKKEFLKDKYSPLTKNDLQYLDFFPADTTWILECSCTRTENAKPFEMPLYSGITRTYIEYSVAECWYQNKWKFNLKLYQSVPQSGSKPMSDYLFLPFKDYTAMDQTYGGGRYMDFKTSDIKDGKIVIDFNKAYNPYCTYSDGYNCPIPPSENHILLPVTAGEKNYLGEYKEKRRK